MYDARAAAAGRFRPARNIEGRRPAVSAFSLCFFAVLLVALFLGGGPLPSAWPGAIVQLASLPLLLLAILRLEPPLQPVARYAIVLTVAIVAVPLFQLIPFPPALWSSLPGRTPIAELYRDAGTALPWLPVSLDPGATWRTILTMIAGLAVFIATLTLERRDRRRATLVLLGFSLFSVLYGLSQTARGDQFYALFANRNHLASLLFCALPFAAAWAIGSAADRRPQLLVSLAICLGAFLILLVGIGVARSRAGLLISMLTVVACFALAGKAREEGPRRIRMIVYIAAGIGMLLVAQFALLRIVPRLEESIGDNARWQFARTSFRAAMQYLPFGSGIGTFPKVYPGHQRLEEIDAFRVNHAHNDYAELWVEGGLLSLAVFAAFLAWLGWAGFRMWRVTGESHVSALDAGIARSGPIVIGALLLHSIVDYPLRTTAISVVFAFACGLLVPPPDLAAPRRKRIRRRRPTRTPRMESIEAGSGAVEVKREPL